MLRVVFSHVGLVSLLGGLLACTPSAGTDARTGPAPDGGAGGEQQGGGSAEGSRRSSGRGGGLTAGRDAGPQVGSRGPAHAGMTGTEGAEASFPLPRRTAPEGEERSARRACQPELWTLPLVVTPRPHPRIADAARGSISIGNVATGYLVDGQALPADSHVHRIMDEQRRRGTNWGSDELAETLLGAAAAVEREYPGARLAVGNLSKGGGGDIPWSISHNSGRDADLGFYMVDEQGNAAFLPAMVPLARPDGSVEMDGRVLRFDVARNWAFVKALLTSGKGRVQYVFCARFLIRKMLEHAAAQGEDRAWLRSLDPVLRQPKGTASHDDHFHVRVYCSARDVLEGCRDIVAGEEIVPRDLPAWRDKVGELTQVLESEAGPADKAAALHLLTLLDARSAAPAIRKAVEKCAEPACEAALRAVETLRLRVDADVLAGLVEKTDSPATAEIAFRLLRRCDATRAAVAGTRLLGDARTLVRPGEVFARTLVVREHAAWLLGWAGRRNDVPLLLGLLGDAEPAVRGAAAWAVNAIAGAAVLDAAALPDPAAAAELWRVWSRKHPSTAGTFRRTLRERGYRVKRFSREEIPELLRAVKDPEDYVSLNAQKTLRKILRSHLRIDIRDKTDAHWNWQREIERK